VNNWPTSIPRPLLCGFPWRVTAGTGRQEAVAAAVHPRSCCPRRPRQLWLRSILRPSKHWGDSNTIMALVFSWSFEKRDGWCFTNYFRYFTKQTFSGPNNIFKVGLHDFIFHWIIVFVY
jgi:hypothetical protein